MFQTFCTGERRRVADERCHVCWREVVLLREKATHANIPYLEAINHRGRCRPLVLAGRSSPSEPAGPAATTPTASTAAPAAAAVNPRLVISLDQGLQVLDASTLAPVFDLELPGFNRLDPACDGRHVVVSTPGGSRSWMPAPGPSRTVITPTTTPPTQPPRTTYPATKPGHVVVHEGRTALFGDGTGKVLVQDSARIAAGPDGTYTTPSAHHGVASSSPNSDLCIC